MGSTASDIACDPAAPPPPPTHRAPLLAILLPPPPSPPFSNQCLCPPILLSPRHTTTTTPFPILCVCNDIFCQRIAPLAHTVLHSLNILTILTRSFLLSHRACLLCVGLPRV